MLHRRALAVAFLLIIACQLASWSSWASAAEKQLLTIDDVYLHDIVKDLLVASDGKSAIYVREWADRSRPLPRHALWRVEGTAEQRRPLESGEPDARQPVLSPDGRTVVFLSDRSRPDGSPAFEPVPRWSDPPGDLWVVPWSGGKAIPLAGKDKPYDHAIADPFYGRVAFSPDGKQLAFVADVRRDPAKQEQTVEGVTVLREDQGEGYEGYGPMQIWVADLAETPGDVAATRVRRLTSDDFWYGDPQWTPDGRSLIVQANRTNDRESVRFSINKNFDLWKIDVDSGKLTQLTTGLGADISPRVSPDGKQLVCVSCPRKGPHADVYNLLVVDLTTDPPQSRVLFDHHGPEAAKAPHGVPSFPLPDDAWLDEQRFYFRTNDAYGSKRQAIDLGQAGARGLDMPAAKDSTEVEKAAARKRLTPPSNAFLDERLQGEQRIVNWKSFDGLAIDGVLTLPPESVAKPPYKMIVFPHGGPHGRASKGFNFVVQLFAANGYAVFQPNFRGSTGYGLKFLDADRFDMGGGDMQDILTGIDALIEQGVVDARRQFVYGASYGGFMTCWLVGHTQQFRAAVPQNAVTDLNVMWGVGDIQSWTEWEFGGRPWEVPEAMRKHSPMTYAGEVKTPTLVLHADHDRRCPIAMGLMFHRALQKNGIETEMVIYHDERHGIEQLPHTADIYRRVLDWFARHDLPAVEGASR